VVPPRGQALPGKVAPDDINVMGPMGRSADDLALALTAMAGPDEIDAEGWRLELPAPRRRALRDFKVAVMLTDPVSETDVEVQDRIQAVADFLSRRRAKVSDRARPDIDTAQSHRVYIQLLRGATCGRLTPAEFRAQAEAAGRLAPDDDSYYARMIRANTQPHHEWHAANEARHRLRWKWVEFFREWDVLICPVAATAAFPHDHVGERYERTISVNGRRVPTTDQLFWAGLGGVVFLPGTVAPAGFTPGGLPVGVQIVGPQYGDRTTIELAKLLEREFQAFVPPPGYE
jgi:amidase